MTDLAKLVENLPLQPGVYHWKDGEGKILYTGKAKELRKRVKSYLRTKSLDRKTWELMQRAEDIEIIVTNTEREALLLEATLIKQHQPKYNLALKDDRKHAWIRVDLDSKYPAFIATREFEKDGAKYYGPYGSIKRLEKFLDTARRFIPVAMCTELEKRKRECMDYHLDRCTGPCQEHISEDDYRLLVEQMCLYLEGREQSLIDHLELQMKEASEKLEFEKAGELRDRLTDIEIILRSQKVVDVDGANRDVLGISRTEQAALIEILLIRGGRMVGRNHYYFEVEMDTTDEELLRAFVEQYYFTLPKVPETIFLPFKISQMKQLNDWLRETICDYVELIVPTEDKHLELIEMAKKNAYQSLRKILVMDDSKSEIVAQAIKELKVAMNLPKAPLHIEGFDIANIQGTDPTGSCVVFRNGQPDNSSYRMFKIRIKETPDDYAMMHEVVYRRYRGVLERNDPLPDLIVVDGGKGQLNMALKALSELGLDYLSVAGIAKREETIFTRDAMDGINLELDSDGLHLVQRIRDEAHRFAQKYHHKLREKRFTGSILEEVPGIGAKRRVALLLTFGSYDRVRKATVEELERVEGMSRKVSVALRDWLDKEDPIL